jgi:transcriptional regulator with XRE-family HTH domain
MNDYDLKNILSKNLKRYRSLRKISQSILAEQVDISVPFLSDIENGKKWLSPKTLAKIANALNIQAYELLKPDNVIPDNSINVIENYTADIASSFSEILEKLQQNYTSQIFHLK